jgi:hypothetical protein
LPKGLLHLAAENGTEPENALLGEAAAELASYPQAV